MNLASLKNCRILVVEDEYLLADELRTELELMEASVIGPVGRLSQAMTLLTQTPDIDAAVLDVNLRGEMVFPFAQSLRERDVPILFVTGYDVSVMPAPFQSTPRCEKPVGVRLIAEKLVEVIGAR